MTAPETIPAAETWTAVDRYFAGALLDRDEVLDAAIQASNDAGLPAIQVTATQGKLLQLLARMIGAKNILEVGTLGGYSTIWMARALPPDGKLTTLEFDAKHAAVARSNFARAGLEALIELQVGKALDLLPRLTKRGPFDLIFLDADKEHNADYVDWALQLSRPGTLLVIDNVVREGKVLDTRSKDESVRGVQRCVRRLQGEARLSATAVQTVGEKGYDGFIIARVES